MIAPSISREETRLTRFVRRSSALLRAEDGNTMVETALSLTLLMSCMVCVMTFSKLIYAKHFASSAARLGTRYAIVRGSSFAGISCSTHANNCTATATDISNYVLSNVSPGLSTSAITVNVNWPGLATSGLSCITLSGVNSPGCVVQVIVSYQVAPSLPLLPSGLSSFQSSSTMMIAQ